MDATFLARVATGLLLMGVAAVIAGGQPAAEPHAAAGPGQLRSLRIAAADPEDLGVVLPGRPVFRRVTFESVLDAVVDLRIEARSCACLETKFEPSSVPARGTTVLTMAVSPVPAHGGQAQSATFRASWPGPEGAESERGVVVVRYETTVAVVVRPEIAGVVAVQGEPAHVDVFVRSVEHDGVAPNFANPECTLPGWTVTRVSPPPWAEGAQWFRARGRATSPGCEEGLIRWAGRDLAPEVPLRVRAIPPWRAQPGGAVFVGAGRETESITMTLLANGPSAPTPRSVGLQHPTPGVGVSLEAPGRVTVSIRRPELGSPRGSVHAEVRDAAGAVLARLPVVWWTD